MWLLKYQSVNMKNCLEQRIYIHFKYVSFSPYQKYTTLYPGDFKIRYTRRTAWAGENISTREIAKVTQSMMCVQRRKP